jgi:hypothetical protein
MSRTKKVIVSVILALGVGVIWREIFSRLLPVENETEMPETIDE